MTQKLTESEKDEIVQRYIDGDNIFAIARAFGVNASYPGLLAKRRGHLPRMKASDREVMAVKASARQARIRERKARRIAYAGKDHG